MNPVPPYCGQDQQQTIQVPAAIAYREPPYASEEGPWAMIPFAYLYPQPPQPTLAVVPPPIRTSDLWSAMQTFPV
jgi:hypothetical protein